MPCVKYNNLLERPFTVYADFESSLIPTGEAVHMHMHRANSACCYVVCTFESSRHKLYEFIGKNCAIELLKVLKIIADDCISEMKEYINTKRQILSNVWSNVLYVKVNLLNQVIKLETIVIEQVIIEERHTQDAT